MEIWQQIRNEVAWEYALERENQLTHAERMSQLAAIIECEEASRRAELQRRGIEPVPWAKE